VPIGTPPFRVHAESKSRESPERNGGRINTEDS